MDSLVTVTEETEEGLERPVKSIVIVVPFWLSNPLFERVIYSLEFEVRAQLKGWAYEIVTYTAFSHDWGHQAGWDVKLFHDGEDGKKLICEHFVGCLDGEQMEIGHSLGSVDSRLWMFPFFEHILKLYGSNRVASVSWKLEANRGWFKISTYIGEPEYE